MGSSRQGVHCFVETMASKDRIIGYTKRRREAWLLGILLSCLYLANKLVVEAAAAVEVEVQNDSGVRLQLGWVRPSDEKIQVLTTLEPFATYGMDSFEGHELEILELPSDGSQDCQLLSKLEALQTSSGDSPSLPSAVETLDGCLLSYFQITSSPEQRFFVNERFQVASVPFQDLESVDPVERVKEAVEPLETLTLCRFNAKRELIKAKGDIRKKRKIMSQLQKCMTDSLAPVLKEKTDEVTFEVGLRSQMASSMENYTCSTILGETTPDVLPPSTWFNPKDQVVRTVHTKLDRQASRIHLVENFVSPEECAEVERKVAGKLGRAMTEDGKGGVHVSKNRKAQQAHIDFEWEKEADGDIIAGLGRRIFDYSSHVLGLEISGEGQEPLMSIQYFGRGDSDLEPDRYTPHCDGRCGGETFVHAGRVATMVLYCTIPDRGGYTNFQNAGISIKPTEGSGIFFSYIDPATNITDHGLTSHSGCPVYEGEKKIITQWVRYGVNAEVPYDAYNSLEVLFSEDGE